MKTSRPSLDEYFLKIAKVVAERSTCRRRSIGAVAVKDKHIISTGYNGAPSGEKDCLELGCLKDKKGIASGSGHDICRATHAEHNVVLQSILHGVSIEGATIYCTLSPCSICARMLVDAKIKEYVCFTQYTDQKAKEIFKEAGIKFRVVKEPK